MASLYEGWPIMATEWRRVVRGHVFRVACCCENATGAVVVVRETTLDVSYSVRNKM